MTMKKSLLGLILLVVVGGALYYSQFRKPSLHIDQANIRSSGEPSADFHIRYVSGDFLTFMRSNPRWSWAWFGENLDRYSQNMQKLAKFEGLVGGDIKPDNVDIVLNSAGKVLDLGLIDYDDGGQGSLLGDLMHTLAYNYIWPTPVGADEAMELYLAGLKGLSSPKPSLIKIVSDYRKLVPRVELIGKITEWLDAPEQFVRALRLTPIDVASPAEKKLFLRSGEQLFAIVEKYGVVKVVAVRTKESGGSQGLSRFVFLLQDKNGLGKIIEAKMTGSPAVKVFAPSQKSLLERMEGLIGAYRPLGDRGAIREFLAFEESGFIIRERVEPVFDGGKFAKTKKLRQLHTDYHRHLFYWLGKKHAEQSREYALEFVKSFSEAQKEILKMANDHIEDSRSLFNKGKTPVN